MAARKTKLTVDWIVTTTGHGSEAGGDPIQYWRSGFLPVNARV